VSPVHAPVPRFAPQALAVARRRAPSALPRGPPPPSPTRPPECLGSTQRIASFTPVQVPSKIVPSSRRLGRLTGVPPACRRSPTGFLSSVRRCRAARPRRRPISIGRSRSLLTPGQTGQYRSTRLAVPAVNSQPPDLDPADQIHSPALTTPFCSKAPRFSQFHNNNLPP
jgi:hypothetical protein